jgi:uracil-DNA glycosylase
MQRRISAFFGPNAAAPAAKRAKLIAAAAYTPTPAAATTTNAGDALPADVAARIAAKRAAALAKLAARRAGGGGSAAFAALEPSWRAALAVTLAEPFWAELRDFVDKERRRVSVFPAAGDVFSAFNSCSLSRVKVVIIGQDPYHGKGQAHGMCFSVQKGVAVPPSLRNMYKELADDAEGWKAPRHGNLEAWARQGVLLLNNVLTVEEGKANSHKGRGWERFTDAVVAAVNKRAGKGVVFMLWGNGARAKGKDINTKKHCVLHAVHPSPLSASRGWFGCKHFSKANKYLVESGQEPIDWTLED